MRFKWSSVILLFVLSGLNPIQAQRYVPESQKVDPKVEAKVDKLLSKILIWLPGWDTR
ncbi:hypothetical protein [Prolixibacter sp. SD074]|jgi:beta-glucosidase|uniref:hypothetical protein n=1 Tax=Prolixibacter sp. SD074 TaxID=2652391 RepID=UPI00127CDF7F|nr:hypothetical protein [Prolixibacter sp. SD074]GET29850.1 hypothetical protein SD074_20520 [Prolixibacter sp. SD074]